MVVVTVVVMVIQVLARVAHRHTLFLVPLTLLEAPECQEDALRVKRGLDVEIDVSRHDIPRHVHRLVCLDIHAVAAGEGVPHRSVLRNANGLRDRRKI